jgi:hypothetical protein
MSFARELRPYAFLTVARLDSTSIRPAHRTFYEHGIKRLLRLTLGSQKNVLSAYQITCDRRALLGGAEVEIRFPKKVNILD